MKQRILNLEILDWPFRRYQIFEVRVKRERLALFYTAENLMKKFGPPFSLYDLYSLRRLYQCGYAANIFLLCGFRTFIEILLLNSNEFVQRGRHFHVI